MATTADNCLLQREPTSNINHSSHQRTSQLLRKISRLCCRTSKHATDSWQEASAERWRI
ncbi:Hypothetical predicted protein, partial [Pelobates cultripes]